MSVNQLNLIMGAGIKRIEDREENDFYATDPKALEVLLDKLKKDGIELSGNVWEIACGKGHLSRVLEERGYSVFNTDLIDRGYENFHLAKDFFEFENEWNGDIITNPPFKCFSLDTECYTKKGWKKYNEITENDEVLSVNSETLELEWSAINRIIIKENDDIMYHFKKSHLDIMCTKNHRMFAFRNGKLLRKNGDLLLSQDIRSQHYIPRVGYFWNGIEQKYFTLPGMFGKCYAQNVYKEEIKILMKDWLRFFGFWLADGYCRHTKNFQGNYRKTVGIKQKADNGDIVRDILNKLPFKYHEYNEKTDYKNPMINFEIHDEQLWYYLKQFGKSRDKFVPDFIKNLPTDDLKLFLDFYFYGDGSKIDSVRRIYRTTSLKLIEDLQEILLKIGYLSHITKSYYRDCLMYSIVYSPNTIYNKLRFPSNKKDACSVDYKGLVWCLNLRKNGVFLLRRNGKEFFCGNCADQFINHSLELVKEGRYVIMFLKIQFLEGQSRYDSLFKNNPPKYIYVFTKRTNTARNGEFDKYKAAPALCYTWMIWQKGFKGEPTLRWLNNE